MGIVDSSTPEFFGRAALERFAARQQQPAHHEPSHAGYLKDYSLPRSRKTTIDGFPTAT
jgi:hypothetical protein